jgi:hypothetical protein
VHELGLAPAVDGRLGRALEEIERVELTREVYDARQAIRDCGRRSGEDGAMRV